MKILLLEDDLLLNEIILEHLEEKKHKVVSVFNGLEAQEKVYEEHFDLLLLDVNVPNIDGFSILEDLRQKKINTPAVFITSLDMIDDVERGFKVGANDYIKKPFELRELDVRIENIKRMFNIEEDFISIDSQIKLDINNLTLIKNEEKIQVAKKECEVLLYLYKNKEKTISIEELTLNIWAYEEAPLASTIRTYIKNLRKYLGEEYIFNIRGVGYRFNK